MTGFLIPAVINSIKSNVLEFNVLDYVETGKEGKKTFPLLQVLAEMYTYYISSGVNYKKRDDLVLIMAPEWKNLLNDCLENTFIGGVKGPGLCNLMGISEVISSEYMGDNMIMVPKEYANLKLYYKRKGSAFKISVYPVYDTRWLLGKMVS